MKSLIILVSNPNETYDVASALDGPDVNITSVFSRIGAICVDIDTNKISLDYIRQFPGIKRVAEYR